MEGREVATTNSPRAFLQTDYTKGDIRINTEGAMVTLIEEIDPDSKEYTSSPTMSTKGLVL